MQFRLSINRARTDTLLEAVKIEKMYGGSMYVHKLVVDADTHIDSEVLRVFFGVDGEAVADCVLAHVETLNDGFNRYECTIPTDLYKAVKTLRNVQMVIALFTVQANEVLQQILTVKPFYFPIQPNALDYENHMTSEEQEVFNSNLVTLTARVNYLAQNLPLNVYTGTLVAKEGTVVDEFLAQIVKVKDFYINSDTSKVFECVAKNETDTAWVFRVSIKGRPGDIVNAFDDNETTDITVEVEHNTDLSYTADNISSIALTIPSKFLHGNAMSINFKTGKTPPSLTFENQTDLPLKVIKDGLDTDEFQPSAERVVSIYIENNGILVKAYIEEI